MNRRERERVRGGGGCRERVYIYMYGMVIVYLTQYISIHIRIYCVTNIKYVWYGNSLFDTIYKYTHKHILCN